MASGKNKTKALAQLFFQIATPSRVDGSLVVGTLLNIPKDSSLTLTPAPVITLQELTVSTSYFIQL